MQAIGTTCMYVVGMLAGAKILGMVPEVCSWLMAAGAAGGAVSSVGAATGAVIGAATGNIGGAIIGSKAGEQATSTKK